MELIESKDKRLNKISIEYSSDEFGEELNSLIRQMFFIMDYNNGVGLAAPQVGINKRLFVIKTPTLQQEFINPIIINNGVEKESGKEGCLSFPGFEQSVKRSTDIYVEYLNSKNEKVRDTLTGFNARVFQHELDHLNGKTLLDYSSIFKKMKYLNGK